MYSCYFFEKNLQGDIIAIFNTSGFKIGAYNYDAWGNFTIDSAATDLERQIVYEINPFRYRGYYYDTETGWYYLQSRYYNPEWGRFLNADGYLNANGDIIGYNMFAYCSNNPVMEIDPTGEGIWIWLLALAVGAIIGGIVNGTVAYNEGERGAELVDDVVLGMGLGAFSTGAIITLVPVATVVITGNAAITILGTPALQVFAIGALGVNFFAFFIAPLFGEEVEGIEFEPASIPTPTRSPNYSSHPALK